MLLTILIGLVTLVYIDAIWLLTPICVLYLLEITEIKFKFEYGKTKFHIEGFNMKHILQVLNL